MLSLSRHWSPSVLSSSSFSYASTKPSVIFYDVRSLVNINELHYDFYKLPEVQTRTKTGVNLSLSPYQARHVKLTPKHALHKSSVVYNINRNTGSVKPAEGDFRSQSLHQFMVVLGLHMKVYYSECKTEHIRLDVEAVQIKAGAEHPGASPYSGCADQKNNTSILCVHNSNVDGGLLDIASCGKKVVQKELNSAYMAELRGPLDWRVSPCMSFDGVNEGIMELFIIRSTQV